MTDLNESKKQKPSRKDRINTYAKFSALAFQMIAIIGLGTYGGVKLDQAYPNAYSLFTIFCSLISVIIAIYYVIKEAKEFSKKQE